MAPSASVIGTGNIIVQIVGDGNRVEPHARHLGLTRYTRRREVREIDGEPSATDLVSAYPRSIELSGRPAAMAVLGVWLHSAATISVRVLVGSAGRGKTRLALELCEQEVTARFLRQTTFGDDRANYFAFEGVVSLDRPIGSGQIMAPKPATAQRDEMA